MLDNYTKPKTLTELRAQVEKTRSNELAKSQIWQLEKNKEAKLEKQIESCKLYSPAAGMVVHGDKSEEGATVRERQRIFWVFEPDSPMMVNVKVPESMVDRVGRGRRFALTLMHSPVRSLMERSRR